MSNLKNDIKEVFTIRVQRSVRGFLKAIGKALVAWFVVTQAIAVVLFLLAPHQVEMGLLSHIRLAIVSDIILMLGVGYFFKSLVVMEGERVAASGKDAVSEEDVVSEEAGKEAL